MVPNDLVLLAALLWFFGFAAQNSSHFEDLAARATAAREGNDIQRAVGLYQQALAANPKWEEGWWFLGSLYYDSDHYAEGRDALRHVVELDPKAAPAWGLLGLCLFETREYGPALGALEKSLTAKGLDPKLEGVLRFHQALLLTRAGKFEDALRAYAWFARRGVQNPQLITGLGLATLRTPKLPDELAADQQDLYTAAGRAGFLSLAGEYAQARQAFAELATRYPEAHYIHYAYGVFLLALDPAAAHEQFELELKNTPDSGAANAMLAWMHLQQNDAAGAFPFAERAARKSPDLPLAQYVYGRVLADRGDLEGAITHLEKTVSAEPKNLEAHVWLANAYARAAQPLKAREQRELSLALSQEEQPVANP